MKTLISQIGWQLKLLAKNNIVNISFIVTIVYGLLLYFLRDLESIDSILVTIVLNDPSIIGYFFLALSIYTERKFQILSAIFTTPILLPHFIISKVVAVSIIGVICSLGLAFSIKGFDFGILNYTIGSLAVCVISALAGLIMLTFSDEFMKFAMKSIPVFLILINGPILQYLGIMDFGMFKYIFPVQGAVDLIDTGISRTEINNIAAYISILLWTPIFYFLAIRLFNKKIVRG